MFIANAANGVLTLEIAQNQNQNQNQNQRQGQKLRLTLMFLCFFLVLSGFGYHNSIKWCSNTPSSVSYILSGQQNASLSIKWENKLPKKKKEKQKNRKTAKKVADKTRNLHTQQLNRMRMWYFFSPVVAGNVVVVVVYAGSVCTLKGCRNSVKTTSKKWLQKCR